MKKLLVIILAVVLTTTMFTSCASIDKALLSTYLNLGEKYLLDLDYEQAIVYFNKVIEVEPRNSRAYMGAAEAYVGLGDVESAIELLRTALDVFSDDEEVTIELLEMLIDIDPATSEWYVTLADIYEGREDTGSAIAVLNDGVNAVTDSDSLILLLQRLIALDPTNVDWYLDLAQVYVDVGNRTSAISTLRQGMDDVGDDKTKLYDKLIEIDSGTTEWYFELAEVYEDKNNISSAVDTLELGLNNFEDDSTKIDFSEELIEIDETNAEWYLTIAYIYIDQSNTESAIAILREGLEKASDTTEIEALLNQLAPDISELVQTSIYYYDETGTSSYGYVYGYNSDGVISGCVEYYDDIIESVRQYNSDGKISLAIYYNSDGSITNRNVYQYDADGNISKMVMYSSSGSATETLEYTCDEEGQVIKVVDYFGGSFLSQTEYEYDEYGNLLLEEEKEYSGDIIDKRSYEYLYDDSSNILRSVASYEVGGWRVSDSSGGSHRISEVVTEYEYDNNGNITSCEQTIYSSDGTSLSSIERYEYDSAGNMISLYASYSGTIIECTIDREYEYDSAGKVQKCVVTTYYADTGTVYSIETLERIN